MNVRGGGGGGDCDAVELCFMAFAAFVAFVVVVMPAAGGRLSLVSPPTSLRTRLEKDEPVLLRELLPLFERNSSSHV